MARYLTSYKNLRIYQNEDFELKLSFLDENHNPIDFTNVTLSSQVRPNQNGYITFNFNISKQNNTIILSLPKSLTSTLPDDYRGEWDLLAIWPDGKFSYLMRGLIIVEETITR
ncbi:MAG: hypothetical protein QXV52_08475 [Nitrososphaeria archaeon]